MNLKKSKGFSTSDPYKWIVKVLTVFCEGFDYHALLNRDHTVTWKSSSDLWQTETNVSNLKIVKMGNFEKFHIAKRVFFQVADYLIVIYYTKKMWSIYVILKKKNVLD